MRYISSDFAFNYIKSDIMSDIKQCEGRQEISSLNIWSNN